MTTLHEAAQQALDALLEIQRVLDDANAQPGGPIADTIWRDEHETLFDYIATEIESLSSALAQQEWQPHPACKPDLLVNSGALRLALNSLRRGTTSQQEIAVELEKTVAAPQAQPDDSDLLTIAAMDGYRMGKKDALAQQGDQHSDAIIRAWQAGFYHAGYTNDQAYADKMAREYAGAAPAPQAQQGEQPVAGFTEAQFDQALSERDLYHDAADQLAAQIAAITGEDIGKHSSVNNPWRNAMLAADDFIAGQIRGLLAQRGEPVPQWRLKGSSDWYDGHPDHSDGGSYETRTLYTAPQAQQPQSLTVISSYTADIDAIRRKEKENGEAFLKKHGIGEKQ